MKSEYFTIAELCFKISSDVDLPRIQNSIFRKFAQSENNAAIEIFINKISIKCQKKNNRSIDRAPNHLDSFSSLRNKKNSRLFFKSLKIKRILSSMQNRSDHVSFLCKGNVFQVIDYSRQCHEIFYLDKTYIYQACSPINRIAANFRQIFSAMIPLFDAIMLHCSGLIRNGKALLFFAPNSGGKSTVIQNNSGDPILNDDQVIIRKSGATIIAHGTPFSILTSGPVSAPVGGLFLLEQSLEFNLQPINRADLIYCLWHEHQKYTFFLPKNLKSRVFNLLCDLCCSVPVYRMSFPKRFVDWQQIDSVLDYFQCNLIKNETSTT